MVTATLTQLIITIPDVNAEERKQQIQKALLTAIQCMAGKDGTETDLRCLAELAKELV